VEVARAVVDSAATVAAEQASEVALAVAVAVLEVAVLEVAVLEVAVEAYSSEANISVCTVDRVDNRMLFNSIHEATGERAETAFRVKRITHVTAWRRIASHEARG
jgi:hypothetical protein